MKRPAVLLLGPSRDAISGVTTHVNALFGSRLAGEFALEHFQVGSEGRGESGASRLLRLALSPFALAAAVLRRGAAVVHLNTSLNAKAWWRDLVYLLVAKACGARVILQVHGGALDRFVFRLRAALRWPDAVVVLSRREQDAWHRLAPDQHVSLLPNGIDCTPYLKYNRSMPPAGAPLRLVYIGRLASGKGLTETIEAMALARSNGVAAHLTIAGNGPEEARLRAQVRDFSLEREVRFAGPTIGEDKALLLSQADVLCLASYSEGLPYALLEAMAAGVVPVVTRVGGVPDVVQEGVHGVFVPVRDCDAIAQAIEALARNRSTLARMSAACRKRIAVAYSIERVAADFSVLYSSLSKPREMTWAP
ncbi:MAG TPA: glycosyltransferase family 4 protein [Burkholderiales bacterium]|nr:glycosyltransferase family 4 protein [Burkholderiales bacterium]